MEVHVTAQTFLLRLFSDRTDWQQVGGSRIVELLINRQVESAVEGVLDAQSVADGKAYLTRLRLVTERLEYEAKAIHDIVDAEKRPRRRMAAAPAI